MWSLRERERERERVEDMSAYWKLLGDLITSTITRDLLWHMNIAIFINTSTRGWQLSPIQPSKLFSFLQTIPVLFASGLLSAISVVLYLGHLISMCHEHLVNLPVKVSLISNFHKSVSSLSIRLLTTKATVLLTKKIWLPHSSLPTMQQCSLFFGCFYVHAFSSFFPKLFLSNKYKNKFGLFRIRSKSLLAYQPLRVIW